MTETEYLKEMGRKIKLARKEKGLYLRDLGKLCNLIMAQFVKLKRAKEIATYLL